MHGYALVVEQIPTERGSLTVVIWMSGTHLSLYGLTWCAVGCRRTRKICPELCELLYSVRCVNSLA